LIATVSILPREQAFEFFYRHAGPRQHARTLHVRRRGNDNDLIEKLDRARLKEQRNVQHDCLHARYALVSQELRLRRAHQRMHDGLEAAQCGRVIDHPL
jgi:hypothetical protein